MIIGCTAMGNEKTRFSVFAGLSFFSASIIDEKMMEVLDVFSWLPAKEISIKETEQI